MKMSEAMRQWMVDNGITSAPEIVSKDEIDRMARNNEGEFLTEADLCYYAPYNPRPNPQTWGKLHDGRIVCTEARDDS